MFEWLKSFFKAPQPTGPPRELATFSTSDGTITQGLITQQDDGWRIECSEQQTIHLFEVPEPGIDQCLLTYQAELKSQDVQGRAYLEMWCRLPGRGEFFSKGFNNAVKGTNNWASYEIPFYLKRGQKPDLVKLNLAVEGSGTVWIRNVRLLQTPLQ